MQQLSSQILFHIIHKLPQESKFKLGLSNKYMLFVVNSYFEFVNPIFRNNLPLFNYLQVSSFNFSLSQFRNSCLHCQRYIKLNQKFINICESCFSHNISYFKINKKQLQVILKSDTPNFISQYDFSFQALISPLSSKYFLKSVRDYAILTQNSVALQIIYDLHHERIQLFQNQQNESFCSQLIDNLDIDPTDKQRIRSLPLVVHFFHNKNYSLINQIQQQLSLIQNYLFKLNNNIQSILSQFSSSRISKSINQQIINKLLSLYNIHLPPNSPVYNDVFSRFKSSKKIYLQILTHLVQHLQESVIFNQIHQLPDIQKTVSQMVSLNFHNTTFNQTYSKQFLLAAQFMGQHSDLQNSYQSLMSQIVSLFFWFDNSSFDTTLLPPHFSSFLNNQVVINTAIGVSIGASFGALITSFIKDLLTPFSQLITGQHNYQTYIILRKGKNFPYKSLDDAEKDDAVVIKYGSFCQSILTFFVSGLCAYVFIKILSHLPKQ